MNRVNSAIRTRCASFLDKHLSPRTKKLLFLASFSAQITPSQKFNGEMLHKLNKILKLSSDDAALKFPIHISGAIWRNRPLDLGVEIDTRALHAQKNARALGLRIVSVMPKWMRYDEDNEMASDVEKLLDNWMHVQA